MKEKFCDWLKRFFEYEFKSRERLLTLIITPLIGFVLSWFITKHWFLFVVEDPLTVLLVAAESISSIFICAIAWRQGNISLEINKRLMLIEQRRDRVETEPRIICVKGDGATYHYDSLRQESFMNAQPVDFGRDPNSTITYGLKLTFLNATNNVVVLRYDGTTLHNDMITRQDNIVKQYPRNNLPTNFVLKPLEEIQYIFLGDPSIFLDMRNNYLLVCFELQNHIGDTYIEDILIHIDMINPQQQHVIDTNYKMTAIKHIISPVIFQ